MATPDSLAAGPAPSQLAALKATLREFAATRSDMPVAEAEREFGSLLLYLIRLAGEHDIDLISAGERGVTPVGATRARKATGRK